MSCFGRQPQDAIYGDKHCFLAADSNVYLHSTFNQVVNSASSFTVAPELRKSLIYSAMGPMLPTNRLRSCASDDPHYWEHCRAGDVTR